MDVQYLEETIFLTHPMMIVRVDWWKYKTSDVAKKVVEELLANKDKNAYSLSRELNIHFSTLYKCIRSQLNDGFIEASSHRPQERNKNEKTELYRLSLKGFEALILSYYYDNAYSNERAHVRNINKILGNAIRNYPSFIPNPFLELPISYSVVFYPYFHEWDSRDYLENFFNIHPYVTTLTRSLNEILKIKYNNPEVTEVNVHNTFFKSSIPITEKEADIVTQLVESSDNSTLF